MSAIVSHEAAHIQLGHQEARALDWLLRAILLAGALALALSSFRRIGLASSPWTLWPLLLSVQLGWQGVMEVGFNAAQRHRELAADRRAAEVVGTEVMVDSLVKWNQASRNDPTRSCFQEWTATHPSALVRIESLLGRR